MPLDLPPPPLMMIWSCHLHPHQALGLKSPAGSLMHTWRERYLSPGTEGQQTLWGQVSPTF